MSTLSTFYSLPDGAKLAYEILSADKLGLPGTVPLVLVNGLNSLGQDFQRLSESLAKSRPVLIFDNRGIGNSTYSISAKSDDVTIESMARDLLALLRGLGWSKLAILGFSMGGTIVQQLLLLPYHPSHPTPLPFEVTHVILAGTMAAPLTEFRYRMRFAPPKSGLSHEEQKEVVRDNVEHFFTPAWVQDVRNAERLQWWLNRMVTGRPFETTRKQLRATGKFSLGDLHRHIPKDIPVLIIHGRIDDIVPYPAGEGVHRRIPHARRVEVGSGPGQIPHDQFGHMWWEYFDISIWRDVLDQFLANNRREKARL